MKIQEQSCWTSKNQNVVGQPQSQPEKPAWSHRTPRGHHQAPHDVSQRSQLALRHKHSSPSSLLFLTFHHSPRCPNTASVPGTFASRSHKGKSSGGGTGEGIPLGRKPALLAILSSSGVCGFPFATWQQLAPLQGAGHSGFTRTLLSVHIIPNSQF